MRAATGITYVYRALKATVVRDHRGMDVELKRGQAYRSSRRLIAHGGELEEIAQEKAEADQEPVKAGPLSNKRMSPPAAAGQTKTEPPVAAGQTKTEG